MANCPRKKPGGGLKLEAASVEKCGGDAADLLFRRAIAAFNTPERRMGVSWAFLFDDPVAEEFATPSDLAAEARDCWLLIGAQHDVEERPVLEFREDKLHAVETFSLSRNPEQAMALVLVSVRHTPVARSLSSRRFRKKKSISTIGVPGGAPSGSE